jgi:hypothetical protein
MEPMRGNDIEGGKGDDIPERAKEVEVEKEDEEEGADDMKETKEEAIGDIEGEIEDGREGEGIEGGVIEGEKKAGEELDDEDAEEDEAEHVIRIEAEVR